MNCCFIIILLLLFGNCGCNQNNDCSNGCNNFGRNSRNNDCVENTNNCTRTQTVITRTECECDSNSNSYQANMTSDSYANNRYSMYNMDNDDCGCRG